MPYVEVDEDVKLFVQDWGSGKPIVFVHGWPLSHEMFEYQLTQLPSRGYRCIALDLRGYGKSDKPWGDHSFDVMADDVRKVLDVLDLQEVTLAGFSMGGAIALHYTGRHDGARLARLALLGAATPCLTRKPDFPQGLDNQTFDNFLQACRTDRAQLNAEFGKATFSHKPVSPAFADWFTSLGMQASAHATAMGVIALRDSDLRPDLARVRIPTLICHGVHDQVAPIAVTAEVNHAGIEGSELVRFENSAHGLFYDQREKLNEELVRFIG